MRRIELHCHLDGAVRPATVADLAALQGLPPPGPVVAPADCGELMTYLRYLGPVLEVLQTPEALERVARELVHDWLADDVTYGEVRFAPELHQRNGMSLDDAVRAVTAGLAAGAAETGVHYGLLLCCLRQQSPEVSEHVVDTAVRHRELVSGVDLAGDESKPGLPHRAAFAAAHAAGLPVTIHAGEAAGPDSVWEALDVLGAARIGHGVRSVGDQALVDRLRRDRIPLEMCPLSNTHTGAVASLPEHPADRLLAAGLAVTISTDARTTSDTTLGREFAALAAEFGWTAEHERRCQDHARAAVFGSAGAEQVDEAGDRAVR
jgi:adenosine deaminase